MRLDKFLKVSRLIFIVSPVDGFLPSLAALSLVSNVHAEQKQGENLFARLFR